MQGELSRRSKRAKIIHVDYESDNPFLIGEAEPHDPESEGPVEVLGSIATARLAEALLWRRRDAASPTLEDVRRCVAGAPTETVEIRRSMRRWRAVVRREQAEFDEQRRNSYEVVELAQLPADGIQGAPPSPRSTRPCGCYHCRGNWRRIAGASVAVLERGIDPLDGDAVAAFARSFLRAKRDQRWLVSLFWDPIVVAPGEEAFTNGRHRTHAMRMVGVEFAAIYTKAGER